MIRTSLKENLQWLFKNKGIATLLILLMEFFSFFVLILFFFQLLHLESKLEPTHLLHWKKTYNSSHFKIEGQYRNAPIIVPGSTISVEAFYGHSATLNVFQNSTLILTRSEKEYLTDIATDQIRFTPSISFRFILSKSIDPQKGPMTIMAHISKTLFKHSLTENNKMYYYPEGEESYDDKTIIPIYAKNEAEIYNIKILDTINLWKHHHTELVKWYLILVLIFSIIYSVQSDEIKQKKNFEIFAVFFLLVIVGLFSIVFSMTSSSPLLELTAGNFNIVIIAKAFIAFFVFIPILLVVLYIIAFLLKLIKIIPKDKKI